MKEADEVENEGMMVRKRNELFVSAIKQEKRKRKAPPNMAGLLGLLVETVEIIRRDRL
jgi:hypothetical protein